MTDLETEAFADSTPDLDALERAFAAAIIHDLLHRDTRYWSKLCPLATKYGVVCRKLEAAGWDESKHLRDEDGQFTDTPSDGSWRTTAAFKHAALRTAVESATGDARFVTLTETFVDALASRGVKITDESLTVKILNQTLTRIESGRGEVLLKVRDPGTDKNRAQLKFAWNNAEGELHVDHLFLHPELQGKGIATEVLSNFQAMAKDLSVKKLTFDASSSAGDDGGKLVGAYVWAKLGAAPATAHQWQRAKDKFVQWADRTNEDAAPLDGAAFDHWPDPKHTDDSYYEFPESVRTMQELADYVDPENPAINGRDFLLSSFTWVANLLPANIPRKIKAAADLEAFDESQHERDDRGRFAEQGADRTPRQVLKQKTETAAVRDASAGLRRLEIRVAPKVLRTALGAVKSIAVLRSKDKNNAAMYYNTHNTVPGGGKGPAIGLEVGKTHSAGSFAHEMGHLLDDLFISAMNVWSTDSTSADPALKTDVDAQAVRALNEGAWDEYTAERERLIAKAVPNARHRPAFRLDLRNAVYGELTRFPTAAPSHYGLTRFVEWKAEAFAVYITAPTVLERKAPKTFALIDAVAKGRVLK